jgi:hypothetical protein
VTTTSNEVLLAHGIGGRQDLPVPFTFALIGAIVALLVSFVALGALWRTPRLDGPHAGVPLPAGVQRLADAPTTRWLLRLLGLPVAAYVLVAAVFGPDLATNPTAAVVYVLLWVGIVPASLLIGPAWRLVNPLRTVHGLIAATLRTPATQGLRPLPARLGWWPAAGGLLAFTWLELAAPDRATLPVLRAWFGIYIAVTLLAAALYGSSWFDRGDAFEAYSTLVGRLAPLGRREDGRLVARNPLQSLDTVRPEPGLVAVVVVLIGSTAFDGLSNSPMWIRAVQGHVDATLAATVGLLCTIGVFGLAYFLAASLSGMLVGPLIPVSRRALPGLFAHSLIPIAVGYVVAHYFSLFVFEGQRALIQLSDPLGTGANVFGPSGRDVDYAVVSPTTIAVVQVLAVVIGHVIGVVSSHDRAVRLFPPRAAVAGQLPLLALMVAYTLAGLTLLFAA